MPSSSQPAVPARRRFLGVSTAAAGLITGALAAGFVEQSRASRAAHSMLAGHFFEDPTFDFQSQIVLGSSYYGGGNPGMLFSILSEIEDGNVESAFQAFNKAGLKARGWAEASERRGHTVSAREAYMWAANYLFTSMYFLDGGPDVSRMRPSYAAYLACWSKAAAMLAPAVEQVSIAYENTSLTGWFYRVDESRRKRPLIIMNNGADGSDLDMYLTGAAGGLRRGYNILTFNGPGQGDALWHKKLSFRADWEKVITPVVDFAVAHPEVDAKRLGLIGISQGGYFVPRALAFEHRLKAAVADPGVWDIGDVGTHHMPQQMRDLLDANKKAQFDQEMSFALKFQGRTRDMLAFRMRPYGVDSYFDFIKALQNYRMRDVVGQITTAMLVTNPESEQFFVGQPKQLFDALTCDKTLLDFSRAEGADIHCELNAPGYRDLRIYDWLDEKLAG
jgi:hypothetical protein